MKQLKTHCINCLCLNVDCSGHDIAECWTGCVFKRTAEKETLVDDTITFAELDKLHEITRPKNQPQKPLWVKKRDEFAAKQEPTQCP